MEQAVKYMTLLRGEPKNMAKEWVREARLLLEARQVCDALMAHASAYGLLRSISHQVIYIFITLSPKNNMLNLYELHSDQSLLHSSAVK